jgi:uncharacterized membrane protein YbhN (UPF0104 family)
MSRFLRFTKIGVSLGLLAAVAYWLDWEKAWNLLRSASPAEFALGLLFLFGAYLANAARLLLLQRRVGLEVPGPLYWGSYYTGLMFNYVLPLGVGGDAVRVVLLNRHGCRLNTLVTSSLVDRFFGLLALFVVGGFAICLFPSAIPLDPGLGRLAGALMGIGALLGLWWLPRLGAALLVRWGKRTGSKIARKIGDSSAFVVHLFKRPWNLITPTALSLLSHTLMILSYAACGYSLLPDVPLIHYFIAIPGVMLVLMLPISLGGLGLREVSTVGLLVWMGADAQAALTLSLVFLAISWISVIPAIFTAVHFGFGAFFLKGRDHA